MSEEFLLYMKLEEILLIWILREEDTPLILDTPAKNLKKAKEKGSSFSLPPCSYLAGKPIHSLVFIRAYFFVIPVYTKD